MEEKFKVVVQEIADMMAMSETLMRRSGRGILSVNISIATEDMQMQLTEGWFDDLDIGNTWKQTKPGYPNEVWHYGKVGKVTVFCIRRNSEVTI